jgi:hypothetical protein
MSQVPKRMSDTVSMFFPARLDSVDDVYSPSPTTVTNRPFVEWGKDLANISVEPISF